MAPPSEQGPDGDDPGSGALVSERRRLLGLGYRMLGSLTEAEDVVQETYARWYALSRDEQDAIASPGAWLTKVAGRICLDQLGSARARRERYVGEWIPEPLPGRAEWLDESTSGSTADPADRVTLDESLSMAFLVVLESMTPAERVAFILHDVFRYPFADVAEVVGRTPAACRQLASSARRRIDSAQAPAPPTARRTELVRRFKEAWEAQDVPALVELLDPDATAVADSGGLAPAVRAPVESASEVARHFARIAERSPDLTIVVSTVNGQPGLVAQLGDVTVAVLAFEVAGDRIRHIWNMRNPEKLGPWRTDS